MARCRGCGRGKLVAPSSLESCWTCCPPLHFRAAGEGDRAACLSSLFPEEVHGGSRPLGVGEDWGLGRLSPAGSCL